MGPQHIAILVSALAIAITVLAIVLGALRIFGAL
jgi:hypothetical protein